MTPKTICISNIQIVLLVLFRYQTVEKMGGGGESAWIGWMAPKTIWISNIQIEILVRFRYRTVEQRGGEERSSRLAG